MCLGHVVEHIEQQTRNSFKNDYLKDAELRTRNSRYFFDVINENYSIF